jgi:hypothetical protein
MNKKLSSQSIEYARLKELNEKVHVNDMAKWFDKKIAGHDMIWKKEISPNKTIPHTIAQY